ncbi:MAG: ACP phosphodiesterase [Cyclobacteriaceae bacterium]
MNYLAHLYLSGDDPEVRIGNFIGDFVRGRTPEQEYPVRMAVGIHLHRNIDAFTDSHPIVRESKLRLRPTYRHYSGVIVDIFYDHFLAKNWDKHHPEPLPDFAMNFYRHADTEAHRLPQKARYVLPFMKKNDWLTNYGNIEGIEKVLGGMARRTPYESGMENASQDLLQYYDLFEREYFEFMPQLEDMCKQSIQELWQRYSVS